MIEIKPLTNKYKAGALETIKSVLYNEYGFAPDAKLDDDLVHLEKYYGSPDGIFLIAIHGPKVVGTAAVRKVFDDACEIKRMFVLPDYRKRGIGNQFMERLISFAKNRGYKHMYLDSIEKMVAARALYKKFGFSETGPYVPNQRAEIYMVKEL